MNDFFHKLFSKLPHPTDAHKSHSPANAQDHSAHATRYQLVQMVLRTIMRKHGIPAHWIELQELVVPGKVQGLGMHVRLVIRHWDSALMNHAQALQNQLLADVKRYEPNWKDWLYGISWQLEMNSTCPYTTLPDKSLFTTQPVAAVAAVAPPAAAPVISAAPAAVFAAPAPVAPSPAPPAPTAQPAPPAPPEAPAHSKLGSEGHANLERLFSIRDNEISQKAEQEGQPGFEDTQPLDDDEKETQKR